MVRNAASGAALIVVMAVGVLNGGCGHQATDADCELIVNRVVELELKAQNVTDPAEIQRRRNETLGLNLDSSKKAWLEGCVGRHISDHALDCVKAAKSADEIVDRCLR